MSDLEIRTENGFARFYCDGERVGFLTETTRADPSMRWSWEAFSHFGFASTREKAIAAAETLAPMWREGRAKDRAKDEAFAKLHPDLQDALSREAKAKFAYDRAFGSRSKSREYVRELELEWLCALDDRVEVQNQIDELAAA